MRALIQACPDAGLQDLGLGLYLILDCALDFRLQILIADFRLRIFRFSRAQAEQVRRTDRVDGGDKCHSKAPTHFFNFVANLQSVIFNLKSSI